MTTSESSQKGKEFIAHASVSEYQVFLSFRGPDCRQGLADGLYNDMITAGIRTFRDNNELQPGDKISDLLPAIGNSEICVPIFSQTFAESAWCLSEVETMVNLEKHIVPIFYKVTPDDVQLKTELYKEALQKRKDFGSEKMKKWEDALMKVPETIGWEVKNTGYAEFSKKFVKTLLTKLEVKKKYVTESLVERHYQKEALIELLNVKSNDERLVVGIYGLSGIGKTTLAAVVFNELLPLARFDCHSFLENIPLTPNVMEKQLLEDLDPKLKDFQGNNPNMKLTQIFHHAKVLIVLDNVSKMEQVQKILEMRHSFGSGSRIIITTKDARVFTEEVLPFEARDMNKDEAFQLFNRHAFRTKAPPRGFEKLSEEVVGLTGYLPLALEVLGGVFSRCRFKKNDWEATINKLKQIPHPDILEKLRLSYDILQDHEKQIFLDIACFFINKEISGAIYMWEASGFHPKVGMEALYSMSLVAIKSEGKFWMHDKVIELGRELVRLECTQNAAKRSRIWSHDESLEALKDKEGKEKVQGLFLEELYDGDLTYEEFSRFGELRLLKLIGSRLAGEFEPIFRKLKWFTWYECPVDLAPSDLSLGKLVVLDLSRSCINESWVGWNLVQTAKNLKVLDLTDCSELKSTPDLSSNETLERLILSGCRQLDKIHISITKLKRLRHLSLNGCHDLKGLPEGFSSVPLQSFSWHQCPLHFDMTNLSSRELEVLDFSHSSISESWAGWSSTEFKEAKKLQVLDLTDCQNLKSSPDLSKNKALKRLVLRDCHNLVEIHSSVRELKLKHMDIDGCSSLGAFPEEFSSPRKPDEMKREDKEAHREDEVFLSFRGPGVRQGLANVIYNNMTTKGIRVFRDDDELKNDDTINVPAIRNSKICVPIFSETFADSVRFLRQVGEMINLKKHIMPIYYRVTPEDVKLNTVLFRGCLRKHERQYGTEQVQMWEEALKQVAKIKGLEVKDRGLAEFSKSFIEALRSKLKVKYVAGFLVHRYYEEEALITLLDISADDVRLVGIHGMGGIGKTTLAKVVFNKLLAGFDCCSFLENIRESVIRNEGEHLQRQLLDELDPTMEHSQGIDPIKLLSQNFRDKKVLIVLDDVNERKHVDMIVGGMDSFGRGSRIIMTTRDRRAFPKEARLLELNEMNQYQALQVFSRHAFGGDFTPPGYHNLSRQVIPLTGRVPLALEVVASLSLARDKREWEYMIEKLQKDPSVAILQHIKNSFDAYEICQKQIFLDVACFFVGRETSRAIYMWKACGFHPAEEIEALVSMSLLKIKGNVFLMNDLVRDVGRALVRRECADDPAKRSRIWSQTEALEVLMMKNKEKLNLEGLFREEPFGGILTNEEFAGFKNLRLLKLVATKLEGDFEHLLPQLRMFSWHRCPPDFVATNLCLRKLVVLDLSRSLITESWEGWSLIQMAKHLKVLDLSDCWNLKSTPDLSNNEALKRLILSGCHNLAEIHASIGMLRRLEHLDLKGCRNLKSTPDFSNNKALERLVLSGCHKLAKLHCSIGKLTRLEHLDLKGCSSLEGLPEEFGSLSDLEEILVDGVGGDFHVPVSIGNFLSLSIIRLRGVKIARIPSLIGGLMKLTHLDLCMCTGIKIVPDAIGDLSSLVELDLSMPEVCVLPQSIGRLHKLRVLRLAGTMVDELPDTIGGLESLEILDMKASLLMFLPYPVGDLTSLLELDLSSTKVVELPNSIGQLAKLRSLNLDSTIIDELPNSLGSLCSLQILSLRSCSSLRILPNSMGDLKSLLELNLSGTMIEKIPRPLWALESLKIIR